MKSKFKVMDILRLIDKQHNMTTGGLYCANQVYDGGADIPVIETVDDYGLVVSLYETSFEATDVVLDTNKTSISEEEATILIKDSFYEFFNMCECSDSNGLIAKIKTDKELQKALLVLMQSGSVEGSK